MLTRRIGLILDLCEDTMGPVREKSRDKANMLRIVWNGRTRTWTKTGFENEDGFLRALAKINYHRWQRMSNFLHHQSMCFRAWTTFFSPDWSWSKSFHVYINFILLIVLWANLFILGIFLVFCHTQYRVESFVEEESPELPIHHPHPQPFSICQVQWAGAGIMLSVKNLISSIEIYLLWALNAAT